MKRNTSPKQNQSGQLSEQTDKNLPLTILLIAGIVLVLFVCIIVSLIPRSSEDIFISLAGGRDIMAGKLGAPDDWSFSTGGRVWFNQNWGADVLFYLVYAISGGTGLVALKLLILLLCAFFIVLLLRSIGIQYIIAFPVAAAVIASMCMYLILRPYFFALLFIPLLLWLLYKTEERPVLIWAVVALTTLWANVHASFIYGLGIVFLRVMCTAVPHLVKKEWQELKKKWHLAAGLITAILLAGIANPFGFKNLIFPFMMVPDGTLENAAWQNITDWRPIWETGELRHYASSIISLIVIVSVTVIMLVFRGAVSASAQSRPEKNKRRTEKKPAAGSTAHQAVPASRGTIVFEAILAGITLIMAVTANRFIIIALIACAPVCARQIAWVIRRQELRFSNAWILPAVMNVILFLYAGLITIDNIRNYDPDNPVMNTGTGSLFEKMHYVNAGYDENVVKFLNDNRISGNIIIPWDWEGYLRWKSPSLKVFIGGRAQQVYDIKTFDQYLFIYGADVARYRGQKPGDVLGYTGAHLLLVRDGDTDEKAIRTMLSLPDWVIIYADDGYLLFADTGSAATASLVQQLENNQLAYPTPAVAAASKAAYISSRPLFREPQKVMELYNRAFFNLPVWLRGFRLFFDTYSIDQAMYFEGTTLLENNLKYLGIMKQIKSKALYMQYCRMFIADTLYKIASNAGANDVAAEFKTTFTQAQTDVEKLRQQWNLLIIK